jgi:hypothetical protein
MTTLVHYFLHRGGFDEYPALAKSGAVINSRLHQPIREQREVVSSDWRCGGATNDKLGQEEAM